MDSRIWHISYLLQYDGRHNRHWWKRRFENKPLLQLFSRYHWQLTNTIPESNEHLHFSEKKWNSLNQKFSVVPHRTLLKKLVWCGVLALQNFSFHFPKKKWKCSLLGGVREKIVKIALRILMLFPYFRLCFHYVPQPTVGSKLYYQLFNRWSLFLTLFASPNNCKGLISNICADCTWGDHELPDYIRRSCKLLAVVLIFTVGNTRTEYDFDSLEEMLFHLASAASINVSRFMM